MSKEEEEEISLSSETSDVGGMIEETPEMEVKSRSESRAECSDCSPSPRLSSTPERRTSTTGAPEDARECPARRSPATSSPPPAQAEARQGAPPAQVVSRSASHAASSEAATIDTAIETTIQATTETASTSLRVPATSAEESRIAHLEKQNGKLLEDLRRLKEHLLAVEDSYTRELLVAEEREKELRDKNVHLECELEREKRSNETNGLRDKLASAIVLRDKALRESSSLEQRVQEACAHVERLQLLLEQTRQESAEKLHALEKERQRELAVERDRVDQLQRRVKWQEERFAESALALGAAGRLADQIDLKESTIRSLKDDSNRKQRELNSLRKQVEEMRLSQVDKALIKNLVIAYLTCGKEKKADVEILLARVLDFNQEEMTKSNLHMTKSGKSGLWQQQHNAPALSPAESSFSALFVQFLQNESTPETTSHSALAASCANKNSQQTRQLAKNLFQHTSSSSSSSSGTSSTVVNPFVSQCLAAEASSSRSSSLTSAGEAPESTSARSADNSFLLHPSHSIAISAPSSSSSSSTGPLTHTHRNPLLGDCLNDSSAN